MRNISPLLKGVITGVSMVLFSLFLINTKQPSDTGLQYINYALLAGGIAWTLLEYGRSPEYTGKFGDAFAQGFRCFIVVVLIMVVFTIVYTLMHPEMAEEAAKYYKEDLIKKGNKTPAEIETLAANAKKQFLTGNVMLTIFGWLITGAVFDAAGSAFLTLRRR